MVAHQKIIKDRLKNNPAEADLFGEWWKGVDTDISKSVVAPISSGVAKAVIEKYEWLGTMPAVVRHCYGIFFANCVGGVVVYGDEYAENLGVWDKYEYTGKILALLRGACTHWAHPHSGSRLIRQSMKLLPPRYKVITCTVDGEAGEVGTIYQACGFDYVGVMSAGGNRANVSSGGKSMSGRQAGRLLGTRGHVALSDMGVVVNAVPRKGRYFAFRGTRREIKELRGAISHLTKPYPKRAG